MFAYEKLEVYKKAFALNQQIYQYLKKEKGIARYVSDQLGRASFSIVLNIAEGSGRFSSKDRRHFYVTARSSAFEVAAVLQFLNSVEELPDIETKEYCDALEEISKILFTLIKNLEK